ncbi:MAG TPA: hypothetical protein VH684_05660 [Xanthobacteraceae bacterium]
MRKFVFPLLSFGAIAAFIGIAALPRPGVSQQAPAGQQEETRPADLPPQPFNPQLAAMMIMLIQPAHTKLGLAGKAENWALAGYMYQELKQRFGVVGRAVPRWKGLPVPDLVDAAMGQVWPVLDFAIKAGEPRQFMESYQKLTQGCNNCHATADHAYVVIKVPDGSPYPDQDFAPTR